MTFGGPVIFKEVKDECVICLETTIKQAKITTHCNHWFCVPCARKLLGWDEGFLKQYELSITVTITVMLALLSPLNASDDG